MKNMIWITTEFEGYHKYKDAPDIVAFLRNTHRHMFKLKIWIEVFHNDRDIEFILFKNYINTLIKDSQLDNNSCEMIADALHEQINEKYPKREIWIEVSEDNENGTFKSYEQ